MRPKVYAALFVSLLLALVCAQPDGSAQAQRRQRQEPADDRAAANENSAARRREQPKRVVVAGSSDTARGTRQTIKSDNPLNDYSAYRSGDRFYVVLPKSDATSVARGSSGRGFSDMQVQQRGEDVVLSYRLKPGARPRVEQKFNRLDVVFEVPEGGQPATPESPQAAAGRAAQQSTPAASQQQPSQQNPARQQAAAQAQNAAAQTPNAAGQAAAPPPASQQPFAPALTPAGQAAAPVGGVQPTETRPTEAQPAATAPDAGQTAPQELAQAQPPVSSPAGTTTTADPAVAGAQAGTSIGAVLLNNWPIALAALLALVGLGLIIAARRSSALSAPPDGEAALHAGASTAALKGDEALGAVRPAAGPIEADTTVPVSANGAAIKAGLKAETATAREAGKVAGQAKKKGAKPAPAPSSAVQEAETSITPAVPLVAAGLAGAAGVAATESAAGEEEARAADGATKELAPAAAAPDSDRVQAETRRLLEGGDYDRAVVGTADPMARQMVAAELLSALAGRQAERRERARAAVAEHGYFDDLVRDLRKASAPAERAAAARSLGLVGDKAATPQLVTALEDRSVDVRRAAVESLASLRDPQAVPALEALIKREKKQKQRVNHKLVQSAIEASRLATAETATAEPPAVTVEGSAAAVIEGPAATAVEEPATTVVEESATTQVPTGIEATEEKGIALAEAPAEAPAPMGLESAGEELSPPVEAAPTFVTSSEFAAPAGEIAPADTAATVETPTMIGAETAVETEAAIEPEATIEVARPIEEETVEIAPFESVEDAGAAAALTESSAIEAAAAEAHAPEVSAVDTAASDLRAADLSPVEETVVEQMPVARLPVDETAVDEASVEQTLAPVDERAHSASFADVSPADDVAIAEVVPAGEVAAADASHAEASAGEVSLGEVAAGEVHTPESGIAEQPAELLADGAPVVAAESFVETPLGEEPASGDAQESGPAPIAEHAFVAPVETSIDAFAPEAEAGLDAPSGEVVSRADDEGRAAQFVFGGVYEQQAEAAGDEWVEFDMSDAAAPEAQVAGTDIAPVIETSSGAPLEANEPIRAATPVEMTGLEPADRPDEIEPKSTETPDAPAYASGQEMGLTAAAAAAAAEPFVAEAEAGAGWAVSPGAAEKGIELFDADSTVPASIQQRLASAEPAERAAAVADLSRLPKDESFRQICAAFDDEALEVRSAAARALYDHDADRAECFTHALRESSPERRRHIGAAINSSGLASEAISQLTGESRERTYEAFSILFLMAKAGEVQPLLRAVEGHPNNEVRLAVVKLLALSGQKEILPAFRRLAVRGSLPTEVRSAVMEAIYQISSQPETTNA
jgi:hypothetical protein